MHDRARHWLQQIAALPSAAPVRIMNVCGGHELAIRRRADDSAFRTVRGIPRPIRLGRGHAPQELILRRPVPCPVLAVGADLKNMVALAIDDRVILSPHQGALGSLRRLQVFARVIDDLCRMHAAEPEMLACDAHPATFRHAGRARGICHCSTSATTRRVASLRPFRLIGGDIGRLVVHGTVNDLAASGATPRYLCLNVFIEEGLKMAVLGRITHSIARMIGVVEALDKLVVLQTSLGGERTLPDLEDDPLPRIC